MPSLPKSGFLAALLIALICLQRPLVAAQEPSQSPKDSNSNPAAAADQKPPGETSAASLPDSKGVEVLASKRADYPMEAREKQIQGEVIVKVTISETGKVELAEVISGDPILARAALEAAKKWTFKPFIKNGKPVKVATRIPFDFAFKGKIMEKGISGDRSTTTDLPRSAPNPSTSGAAPSRVRVSAGVVQGLLIHQVAPVYPEEARRKRIDGVILLQAIIDKEGRIADLKLISGPTELAPAAIGAVQQWRYRPYLLNGQPVEVQTQIQVNFTLHLF
jgi:TonB family protein